MKKASDILLLLSSIFSFIAFGALIITGLILIVLALPSNSQWIVDGLNNGTVYSSFGTTIEEKTAIVQLVLALSSIVVFVIAILALPCAILALLAKNKGGTSLYVAALVFSILTTETLGIVGAILGLIDESEKSKFNSKSI